MLSACVRSTPHVVKSEPLPIFVEPDCFAACEPLPKWQPDRDDGSGDWDVLGAQQGDIAGQYGACDARREACAQALRRLDATKVIRLHGSPED